MFVQSVPESFDAIIEPGSPGLTAIIAGYALIALAVIGVATCMFIVRKNKRFHVLWVSVYCLLVAVLACVSVLGSIVHRSDIEREHLEEAITEQYDLIQVKVYLDLFGNAVSYKGVVATGADVNPFDEEAGYYHIEGALTAQGNSSYKVTVISYEPINYLEYINGKS